MPSYNSKDGRTPTHLMTRCSLPLQFYKAIRAITKEYSHFFEYIVVDELQDFTPAQANLLLQLSTVQHNVIALETGIRRFV